MNDWINFEILSHPANWVIIFLILLLSTYAFYTIYANLGVLTPSIVIAPQGT
jgi:hypothetical protein